MTEIGAILSVFITYIVIVTVLWYKEWRRRKVVEKQLKESNWQLQNFLRP